MKSRCVIFATLLSVVSGAPSGGFNGAPATQNGIPWSMGDPQGWSPLSTDGFTDKWLSPVYNYIFTFPLPIPGRMTRQSTYTNSTTGQRIDFYNINIKKFQRQIYPNLGPANLVGYEGTYPGPSFRIQRGVETVVRFNNGNDRPSVIHLHGSPSRAVFDGFAEDEILPGQYKDYYYPNSQPARMLWYHDHADHITTVNVYYGQAGAYILEDPAQEAKFDLPRGRYEIPLVVDAKTYGPDGDLVSPEAERDSFYGDVIAVNGQPWPILEVEPRKYRFRLLCATVSRSYLLGFFTDAGVVVPMTIIGTDAGYNTNPVQTNDLVFSPAERYDIIMDFSGFQNSNVTLYNKRKFQTNEEFAATNRVMRFVVGATVSDQVGNGPLPTTLLSDLGAGLPQNSVITRNFKFEKSGGWLINGFGFSDRAHRLMAKPEIGNTELWDLLNGSGGWSHPIHIHLVDLKLVSRSGSHRSLEVYEQNSMKDVVYLGTGEEVVVVAKFLPWAGQYMFHCHNTVHEDHDMMAVFNVTNDVKMITLGHEDLYQDPLNPVWRAKSGIPPAATPEFLKALQDLGIYKDALAIEAMFP